MKGIILAGGTGSRLYPITQAISKQLMPIYDKPMIYYPLTTLMQAGIREILIVTTKPDQAQFKHLLGDGSQWGCTFSYTTQDHPRGLADAFIVGEEFIGNDSVAMVLGDNIFYGHSFGENLKQNTNPDGGVVFAYQVSDPERYGVVDFDNDMKVTSIEEKPKNPRSHFAIPGLYFFDNHVSQYAKEVKPSERGEIEITEIHNAYLREGRLKVSVIDRGTAWLDTGTFESMMQAADFVRVIEERQGIKIGSPEETAWREGWITSERLAELAQPLTKSGYGRYLNQLLESL